MLTYKFTRKARQDLVTIIEYTVDTWDSSQAAKYIDGLEKLVETLAQSPQLGKDCRDLVEGLLVFPYEKHLIYYRIEPHGITVARVLHSNMDMGRQFLIR